MAMVTRNRRNVGGLLTARAMSRSIGRVLSTLPTRNALLRTAPRVAALAMMVLANTPHATHQSPVRAPAIAPDHVTVGAPSLPLVTMAAASLPSDTNPNLATPPTATPQSDPNPNPAAALPPATITRAKKSPNARPQSPLIRRTGKTKK